MDCNDLQNNTKGLDNHEIQSSSNGNFQQEELNDRMKSLVVDDKDEVQLQQTKTWTVPSNEDIDQLDLTFVNEQNILYNELYSDYPISVGKAISKKERKDRLFTESFLIYGEITFESFGIALEKIKKIYGVSSGILQESGEVFYDLGSGTGKPVFAAALLHNFKKVCGIEILEGLHKASLQILEKWKQQIKPLLPISQQSTTVSFIHGDALDPSVCDWTDGDVIFANSTCFDETLMLKIARRAELLKPGAIVITLTKKLASSSFEVLESKLLTMSWGSATMYIQQKINTLSINEI